jgi:hypothetical protein
MVEQSDVILELFNSKSNVQVLPGYYRGLDGLRALVDFSGGRVPAHPAASFIPEVNDPVWVAVVDGVAWMLGPSVLRPGNGEVVSEAAGIAIVDTIIGHVPATYNSGATLSPGDQVKLYWNEGCHVIGVRSDSPAAPDAPPPVVGGGVQQTVSFSAIDSGSYQSGYGWRINDVWSSSSNIGAWFYGTKIRDTIPDSAVIDSAEIYLPLLKDLGLFPFGRHDYATKPSGAVSFSGVTTLPGKSGWVPIPVSLIDHLKVNTGGLGFDLGGYNIWAGTQKDGQSGTVRVTYTT